MIFYVKDTCPISNILYGSGEGAEFLQQVDHGGGAARAGARQEPQAAADHSGAQTWTTPGQGSYI